jgi:hypothetical protein
MHSAGVLEGRTKQAIAVAAEHVVIKSCHNSGEASDGNRHNDSRFGRRVLPSSGAPSGSWLAAGRKAHRGVCWRRHSCWSCRTADQRRASPRRKSTQRRGGSAAAVNCPESFALTLRQPRRIRLRRNSRLRPSLIAPSSARPHLSPVRRCGPAARNGACLRWRGRRLPRRKYRWAPVGICAPCQSLQNPGGG